MDLQQLVYLQVHIGYLIMKLQHLEQQLVYWNVTLEID